MTEPVHESALLLQAQQRHRSHSEENQGNRTPDMSTRRCTSIRSGRPGSRIGRASSRIRGICTIVLLNLLHHKLGRIFPIFLDIAQMHRDVVKIAGTRTVGIQGIAITLQFCLPLVEHGAGIVLARE